MSELEVVLSATNEDDVNETGVELTTDGVLVVATDAVKLVDVVRLVELVDALVVEVFWSR